MGLGVHYKVYASLPGNTGQYRLWVRPERVRLNPDILHPDPLLIAISLPIYFVILLP